MTAVIGGHTTWRNDVKRFAALNFYCLVLIGIGALSDIAILSYSSDGWFFELHVIFKALLNGLSEIDDIRNW